MRRFFLSTPLSPVMQIQGGDAYHLGKVLRMKPGDEVVLVGTDGQTCRAELTDIQPDKVEASLLEVLREHREPPVNVYLAQGLTKNDKMDFIVQKAVELGVAGIIPLALEHSVVKYDETKKENRRQRWQKIAAEAAKQCQRMVIPEISPISSLQGLFEGLASDIEVIMLYEGQAPQGLKTVLQSCEISSYVLLIGPEGGFSSSEVEYCRLHGAKIVKLGPRILRTETAAVAAITALMYDLGDLGGL